MSKYENELYFNDKKNPMRWMEKKTALIQLSKLLPKDYYSQKAIEIDNVIQGGATLTLGNNKEIEIIDDDKKKPVMIPKRFRNIGATLGEPPEGEE